MITRQRLYADLQNFLTHALAEPHLESRLYAFYSLSLTAYCLDLVPRWSNVSFGCHPQSYFSHHAGTEQSDEHHRRIPDFAAIITSISTTGIVYDTLVFWVEVKPLDGHAAGNPDSVKSVKDIADAIAVNSIIQVNEQALFSFRHFEGNIHYAFLMVGAYFTLLEYERPSNLTPYVRPAGSLPTSPQKRARSDIRKNVHDDLGDPASIEPEVLYFNEPIFIDRVAGFSPLYLRALDAVAEASVGLFQDFGRPTVFGGPRAVAQPPGERVSFRIMAQDYCVPDFLVLHTGVADYSQLGRTWCIPSYSGNNKDMPKRSLLPLRILPCYQWRLQYPSSNLARLTFQPYDLRL